MSQAPVVILAGGTGGHVFAGIALAEALQELAVPVVFMGHAGGLEAELVPARGYAFEPLQLATWRNRSWVGRLQAAALVAATTLRCCRLFRRIRPRSVVSMGCFIAAPGGLAARLCRIPLIVHEQNERWGQTNRWLARIASQRCWASRQAQSTAGMEYCPSPVRTEMAALLGHKSGKAGDCVLVLGGSAGSQRLNDQVPEILAQLAAGYRFRVVHQTGDAEAARQIQARYQEAGIAAECAPFFADIHSHYERATLAVSLAGALSIAELEIAGIPTVLVPLAEAADDHQLANARVAVERGTARYVNGVSGAALGREIERMLSCPLDPLPLDCRRALASGAHNLARRCLQASADSPPC